MKFPQITINFSSEGYFSFYYLKTENDLENNTLDEENPNFLFKIKEEELFKLEKERLGFDPKKVVFVGMANVSKSNWCKYKSYLNSIEEEKMFFGAYLTDRLFYSADLELIKKRPLNIKELLEIGDNIEIKDIEKLLEQKQIDKKIIDERDPKSMDPFEKGKYYENKYAEKYKSIRWNFRNECFILLGFPDGIDKKLVYEFKYSGNHKYIQTTLEAAQYQANFYALNYNKEKIRIQIYLEDINELKTFEFEPSKKNSEWLITEWKNMINGKLPKYPYDKPYVCKSCKFNDSCKLLNSK